MERDPDEPDTENVAYMDEYPHLREKVQLRRMGEVVLFKSDMGKTVLTLYETTEEPEPPKPAA